MKSLPSKQDESVKNDYEKYTQSHRHKPQSPETLNTNCPPIKTT